ncbi:cation efflux protein [Fomitiporia mediterranea MF3/22]|uniref:cation efflux protein n=1 Tax=Fomitiporia mediterranea (strain MF3/22) TaxID=694068 RepID=UPI000440976D|nr:cation efflux protein [Fomitiporia mediterranea MF3/22]EJD07475.1 cation efflux protein [Fomitiporia mediterranea MF3/22]
MLFVQQACLLTALYRISAIRVALFTNFASFWVGALVQHDSMRKTTILGVTFLFSFLSDMGFTLSNVKYALPGYVVVFIYGLSTVGLEHTQSVLAPALGVKATSMATILGATVIGLPFYLFKSLVYESTDAPAAPLVAFVALPALAYSLLYLTPRTRETVSAVALPAKHFRISYASTLVPALILGPLAFSQFPSWSDCIVAGLLFYGSAPDSTQTLASPPRTPTIRLAKAYLKTVLANPESRKIFYFLILNLAYMLVQMLYGVWTNSLGLISDAIHMAFDCMAIAMGLFASVMATWPPNERFTYGYGRIETLSGFANGIFLILISIFIVFEAIQRIIDPPEMNTSQLLLVSTLGLLVNLFGMFAMGGHHHHGHSHSHGHPHGGESTSHSGHGHSHSHSPELRISHSHHDHDHDRNHSHSPISNSSTISDSIEACSGEHHHDHEEHNASHHGLAPHYATPTHSSSAHVHAHGDGHLHVPQINGATVPASAPPGTTRFHVRSVSLHIPAGHNLSPPLNSPPSPNGHLLPNPPHMSRHTRTPSMMPAPGLLSPSLSENNPSSPLTPSYQFGHDAHFAQHHDHSHGGHVPNLHDHSHSHGGDHEGHSHNMRGVFLHVMADTLGSVGVIISTLLIQFYGWTGFDPIASLFIAILIVASVVPLVIDSGKVLCLDVSDRENSIKQALAELSMVDGLVNYTAPRFWPKDSSSLIGSIHVQLARATPSLDDTTKATWVSAERVVERVDSILRRRISGLEELTIQVEGSGPASVSS